RVFGIGDIRRHGSGTIGIANGLRTAGTLPAVLTLLGDVVKGVLAVWVGSYVAGSVVIGGAIAAAAAVFGNCWSVFLGFRGGKGVATGLGALLFLLGPWALLPSLIVFVVVVVTTRFVSLGSLLATLGAPLVALALGKPLPSVLAVTVIALIVVGRHHENIARLVGGTENRLGRKAGA